MSPIKKRGVVTLFLISFNGVLIIKHEQVLGFFSIDLSSFYKTGFVTWSNKSTGLLPYLSRASLEAPLINRERTGRVLFNASTLFTAKWRGV